MRRNLIILLIGLLILSYGQFMMSPLVEKTSCSQPAVPNEGCDKDVMQYGLVENENRDPVRIAGSVVILGAGFLIVGD